MIAITCDCKTMLPIDQIEAFQGKLKSTDLTNFNKLKKSILAYGFSFPIFVWNNKILDGHQRLAAVKRLVDEGEELKNNELPVVKIEAENEMEAAEKLLLINSRYAKIDQIGFEEYIKKFKINMEKFGGIIEIPEINLNLDQKDGVDNDETTIENDGLEYKILIECENETEQINTIEQIEKIGIQCKPLIL